MAPQVSIFARRLADSLRAASAMLRATSPRDREQAAAFDAEGLTRCARGARTLGKLAIGLLVASAAMSYAAGDAHASRLLAIRLLGATALGAVLWQLRWTERHARLSALAMILVIAATMEALAVYTGGRASVQHDRLTVVILGAAVMVTWPPVWVALAAGGVVAMFLLNPLAAEGFTAGPPFVSDLGYLLTSSTVAVAIGAARERRRLQEFGVRRAREAASRQLAEQEARYRSVVETAGSAIVVLAPDHRILEFNAEAERIYGRRREDVLGGDYLRLFVPEHAWGTAAEVVRRVLAGRPPRLAEAVVQRVDGAKRIVLWKNACLRDADGHPIALLAAGQDVTERKRTERALQRSEARLRRLVETTKAIPWEADAASLRFTYVGPQAAALGHPLEQWSEPDFWTTHIHPDDRDRAVETCLASTQRLQEHELEYRMLAADGRIVWLHDSVSVEGWEGIPRTVRGFMIDVTERKHAEDEVRRLNEELEARVMARTAELRDSEARLRSILEASPIGMAVVDDDGQLVEANPALRALLGRPGGNSMALTEIVHPDDAERTLAAVTALRSRNADVRTVDMRYVRRDGAVVWAHTAVVAAGPGVGPRRVFAMIQDVTARKREEALAEGERRALRLLAQDRGLGSALGALLESLERNEPQMICSVLVTDEQGRRLRHGAAPRLDEEYNRAVDGIEIGPAAGSCGTAAYRRARVVVENIEHDPLWTQFRALALPRGLRACWSQPIFSATRQLLGTFALYYRTPHGPTDAELGLIEAAARTAAIVIERQRLDDLLQKHRNELAHVGRVSLLAELAGGLAHEMQQPLASIVNYAGGCERLLRAGAIQPAQLLDAMGRIQSTALRAGQIIHGIRSLAQKREPRRERVDVNDVARSAVQLIEGEARAHGVCIRLDLTAPVPPVQADRIQIEQVLLNLLSNGLEAMVPDGSGDLTIRTWVRGDGAVAVAVRDTGQGIRPDVANRMFEPFFTTKPLGLGLGLSIGRTIVQAHGGVMWAAPDVEGGATVGFALPAATMAGLRRARRRVEVGPDGVEPLGERSVDGGVRSALSTRR